MEHPEIIVLRYLVDAMVDKPEKVEIDRSVDGMGVLLTLRVDQCDMGRIVGKGGKTAEAMRLILKVHGMKTNNRVSLKINEPYGSTQQH